LNSIALTHTLTHVAIRTHQAYLACPAYQAYSGRRGGSGVAT